MGGEVSVPEMRALSSIDGLTELQPAIGQRRSLVSHVTYFVVGRLQTQFDIGTESVSPSLCLYPDF